jgi:hypothetical protein
LLDRAAYRLTVAACRLAAPLEPVARPHRLLTDRRRPATDACRPRLMHGGA